MPESETWSENCSFAWHFFSRKKSSCSGCFFETAIIYFSSDPDCMSTKSVINRLPLDELKGRAGKDKNSTHTHQTFPSNLISPLNEKFASFHVIKGRPFHYFRPFLFSIEWLRCQRSKRSIWLMGEGERRKGIRNSKIRGGEPTCRRHSLFPFDSILSIRYLLLLLLLAMRDTEGIDHRRIPIRRRKTIPQFSSRLCPPMPLFLHSCTLPSPPLNIRAKPVWKFGFGTEWKENPFPPLSQTAQIG